MAALSAASWTNFVISDVKIIGRKRRVSGSMDIGNGADTYPAAGVPMPSFSSLGFYRAVEDIRFTGVNGKATDYLPTFSKAANKVQFWAQTPNAAQGTTPLDELGGTAPAARTYSFEAWGW